MGAKSNFTLEQPSVKEILWCNVDQDGASVIFGVRETIKHALACEVYTIRLPAWSILNAAMSKVFVPDSWIEKNEKEIERWERQKGEIPPAKQITACEKCRSLRPIPLRRHRGQADQMEEYSRL